MLNSSKLTKLVIKNSIVNGDFRGGVNPWVADDATNYVGEGVLVNTALGNYSGCHLRQDNVFEVGRLYFVKAVARITSAAATAISLRDGYYPFLYLDNPAENFWYSMFGKRVMESTTLRIGHGYPDAATANGKRLEVWGRFYGVRAIDITDTPLANKTAADLNKIFTSWFEKTVDLSDKITLFN